MMYLIWFFLIIVPTVIIVKETTLQEYTNWKVTIYATAVFLIGFNILNGGMV